MNCGRADCTGIHDKAKPASTWCSRTREASCKARQRRVRTEGTYEYDRVHGLGTPGEVRRETDRRLRRTEGTFKHSEMHGLGVPGLRKYLIDRHYVLLRGRIEVAAQLEDVRAQIALLEEEVARG